MGAVTKSAYGGQGLALLQVHRVENLWWSSWRRQASRGAISASVPEVGCGMGSKGEHDRGDEDVSRPGENIRCVSTYLKGFPDKASRPGKRALLDGKCGGLSLEGRDGGGEGGRRGATRLLGWILSSGCSGCISCETQYRRLGALDELGGLAVLARLTEFQRQGVKIIGVLDAGHGAEGVPKQATSLLQMPNGLIGPVATVLYPACYRVHALDPGVLGRGKEVGAYIA